MSDALFALIYSAALTEDATFPTDEKKRWLAKKDDADLKLMAESKIEVRRLGQREVTALIVFEKRAIFCISGYERPEDTPAGLTEIAATPGLFATFVTEANISSVATAAQARDILEFQHKEIDGYEGHDLDEIARLFPKLLFWEVQAPGSNQFATDIFRISGSFVIRSYGRYPLEMSQSTKSKIIDIFENGPEFLPFPLLLQGILSYSWHSIFLDFYRCIEQLYSAPRLKELSERFEFGCTLSEVAEAFESFLAWRPKEEEALALLLKEASQPVLDALIEAIFEQAGDKPDATPAKCASQIYRLRNSHVHFRPAMRPRDRTSDNWDSVISAMCDALTEIYDRYGADFLVKKQKSSGVSLGVAV